MQSRLEDTEMILRYDIQQRLMGAMALPTTKYYQVVTIRLTRRRYFVASAVRTEKGRGKEHSRDKFDLARIAPKVTLAHRVQMRHYYYIGIILRRDANASTSIRPWLQLLQLALFLAFSLV